jgi:acyl-CoA synthetase (AMP-forming)/AMP-acid ligase II
MPGAWDNDGSRLNRPELTDYLDADGGIVLPHRSVAAGVIPRTTSGKLARQACRAQYLSGELGLRGHS